MTQRYPGGFITKTPPTVSTSSAYGVWTLDQALQYIKAGTWPVSDPYFFYNTLLLSGNGTNGAQNNTFLDSSTNNFTITRNGNTTQGTFTPYGSNWGNYFGGSDYIATPSDAKFGTGTGNFTIEAWVFITSLNGSTENNIIGNGSSNGYLLGFFGSSVYLATNGGGYTVQITYTLPLNQWVHVAAVRSGNTGTIYINGTSIGSGSYTTNVPTGVGVVGGDYRGGTSYTMRGYVSNARISNTARYSSNFTPSTTPLTSDANTLLLTCQSNRFIDNSASPLTLTVTGSPSVQRFSPFKPSAPYAAGTIGGSGYFDGSGDYLSLPFTTPLQLGTGDFTIEFWMYAIGFGGVISQSVVDEGSGNNTGWTMLCGPASVGMYMQGFDISTLVQSGSYSRAWTHVAVTRSGTTFRLFVNGVLSKTLSGTYDMNAAYNVRPDTPTLVGTHELQYPNYYTGYVSSLRILKGSALYTATFTPPTSPLTAITNTQLLLNYTNGGIIDNAMMNDLETVGNAQISTSVSKFGGGSMSFASATDWLTTPYSVTEEPSSGNLTWEMWINTTNSTPYATLYSRTPASFATGMWSLMMNLASSTTGDVGLYVADYSAGGPLLQTTGVNVRDGAWHHIAVVRNGSAWTLYVDGVSRATGTWSGTIAAIAYGPYIARDQFYGRTYVGYIDDLRITKGIARYTANFTPPTAAFPLS